MGGVLVPPNSHSTGSLSSVSPRILDRSGCAIPSWNSGGKGAENLRRQPERREAVGGEGDVHRTGGFTFSPLGAMGHGRADVIAGTTRPSQRRACPAS